MTTLAKFTASFKKTKNATQTRPPMEVSYMALEPVDIPGLDQEHVTKVLNSQIENYAKQLIAENSEDWNFCPSADSLDWNSFIADFLAPSQRGQRILSKVRLEKYGAEFATYLTSKLGKSEAAAAANSKAIVSKFDGLDSQALAKIGENLADFEPSDELNQVHNALIELLTAKIGNVVTASDL